jgi:hypothetical protein
MNKNQMYFIIYLESPEVDTVPSGFSSTGTLQPFSYERGIVGATDLLGASDLHNVIHALLVDGLNNYLLTVGVSFGLKNFANLINEVGGHKDSHAEEED